MNGVLVIGGKGRKDVGKAVADAIRKETQSTKVNLTCFVEALSKFNKQPEFDGERYSLMVETMEYRLSKRKPFDDSVVPLNFIMVNLRAVVVMYDGREMLTWEIE